jgi:hypothetical protein
MMHLARLERNIGNIQSKTAICAMRSHAGATVQVDTEGPEEDADSSFVAKL